MTEREQRIVHVAFDADRFPCSSKSGFIIKLIEHQLTTTFHVFRKHSSSQIQKYRSGPISRVLSWTIIYLRLRLLEVSSSLPGSANGTDRPVPETPKRPELLPAWPCSRWGLPSQIGYPTCWCALTAPFHPYLGRPKTSPRPVRKQHSGGLLSAALARSFRTVGVTHHRILWSPDFPRQSRNSDAIAWPTSVIHHCEPMRHNQVATRFCLNVAPVAQN